MDNSKNFKCLNVGCGTLQRSDDEVGFDINLACKPNVCGDIERLPFKDGTFDEIRCYHVLEHIPGIVETMNECWRVLATGGKMKIRVPGFPNVQAVQDPTHIRFFVPQTFGYFCRNGALPGLQHTFEMKDLHAEDWELVSTFEKN